jgi:hypothetical protein
VSRVVACVALMLILFACFKGEDMNGEDMNGEDLILNLEPPRVSVDDMTVTAQVKQVGTVWEVVVVFSRLSEQPPMGAAEVQVQLLASDGEAMDLLEAPKGGLPEFGGGLGTSVNARYRFGKRTLPPAHLIVRHRTKEVDFRLVPAR